MEGESNGNGNTRGGKNPKRGRRLRLTPDNLAEALIANGGNQIQAARAAGFEGSPDTLKVTGSQIFRTPNVLSRVRARVEGSAATADEVLALLGSHLRGDVADFVDCWDERGELDLRKAQEFGVSRNIKKLIYTPVSVELPNGTYMIARRTTLELHDSQSAAATLAKMMGLDRSVDAGGREQQAKNEVFERLIALTMTEFGEGEEEARRRLLAEVPESAELIQ